MFSDENDEERESLLVSIWARIPSKTRREIVYVFDFTTSPLAFVERLNGFGNRPRRSLGGIMDHIRELQEVAGLVDLTMVVKVRGGDDEKAATEEVAKLESWLKRLVRMEVV